MTHPTGPDAPPTRHPHTWNAAAQASINAADALAATLTQSERWDRVEVTAGARERRGRLIDRLVADAKHAGATQERDHIVQRVYAYASSLSNERERLLAAKVAERIEQGL